MLIVLSGLFKLADNKTFSDSEILEATNLLKTQYYFLKWDDLLLFVQQVKLGKYNDIYNRWDMPTFFQMLDRYVEERVQTATTINRVQATERKNEPLSPRTLELIKQFVSKPSPQRAKGYGVINSEKSNVDILVNTWIEEFKKKAGSLRNFLDLNGKKLDIHAFLALKQKEYNENN